MCLSPGAAAPTPSPSCPLSLSMTNNDGYSCQAWGLLRRGRVGGRQPPTTSSSLARSPLPIQRAHPLRGSRLCAEPGDIATHRTALFPDKETCAVVSVVRRVTRQGWGSSEKGARELGLEHRRPGSCGGRGLPEGPARVTPPRGHKSSGSLLGKAVGAVRPPGVAPVLEGSLGLLWAGQTPRCGAAGTGIQVKVLGSGR